MITTCYLYIVEWYNSNQEARKTLIKYYGSKKSGTIYIMANGESQAGVIAREMFTRNGYQVPNNLIVRRSKHINQALMLI